MIALIIVALFFAVAGGWLAFKWALWLADEAYKGRPVILKNGKVSNFFKYKE